MVLGTVGYMSPEQVRGKTADHRADIFAFGAILYEMLTGKRAFRKPTSTETMTAILNEDPPAISQIAPGTPPALLRIVHRCLEKNPEQRFHSASDLAFALEALSDSGSSSVAAIEQESHSRWIWIAAAAAVVALAAALIAWWRMPPAVPVVESVTQLTDDGEAKTRPLAAMDRGSISMKDRPGAGRSHRSPSGADPPHRSTTKLVESPDYRAWHRMVPNYSHFSGGIGFTNESLVVDSTSGGRTPPPRQHRGQLCGFLP